CFLGGIDGLHRLPAMNRGFPKDGGFGGGAGLVVVILERQKQRQIRIAVERSLVGAQVDGAEPGNKTVVSKIQLKTSVSNLFLGAVVNLGTKAGTHRFADLHQTANPRSGFGRPTGEMKHDIDFPKQNKYIVNAG